LHGLAQQQLQRLTLVSGSIHPAGVPPPVPTALLPVRGSSSITKSKTFGAPAFWAVFGRGGRAGAHSLAPSAGLPKYCKHWNVWNTHILGSVLARRPGGRPRPCSPRGAPWLLQKIELFGALTFWAVSWRGGRAGAHSLAPRAGLSGFSGIGKHESRSSQQTRALAVLGQWPFFFPPGSRSSPDRNLSPRSRWIAGVESDARMSKVHTLARNSPTPPHYPPLQSTPTQSLTQTPAPKPTPNPNPAPTRALPFSGVVCLGLGPPAIFAPSADGRLWPTVTVVTVASGRP